MSDHMQPEEANQNKKETEIDQDANGHATQEKQKSCLTPGLPNSSCYPHVACFFFFSLSAAYKSSCAFL